jgi:hypothetical protein
MFFLVLFGKTTGSPSFFFRKNGFDLFSIGGIDMLIFGNEAVI